MGNDPPLDIEINTVNTLLSYIQRSPEYLRIQESSHTYVG